MFDTAAKKGSKGFVPGAQVINGMKLSNQRDTGFYEGQNLIGDADKTRMNIYSKIGGPDPSSVSYPITRYRSRRP